MANLIAWLNNSIVEVKPSNERYRVHYLNVSKKFEFEHIEHHASGAIDNAAKDKIKEINGFNGVKNLIARGIIRIIEKPDYFKELNVGQKITEINL